MREKGVLHGTKHLTQARKLVGIEMDPNLAGKWISPMHPEVVKDAPGACDICGMPLVRAESLGYVAADADEKSPPLVLMARIMAEDAVAGLGIVGVG